MFARPFRKFPGIVGQRFYSASASSKKGINSRNQSALFYTLAAITVTLGASYASVPLYRLFCSATGFGGTPGVSSSNPNAFKSHADLKPSNKTKLFKVHFNSDVSAALPWSFKPVQKEVTVIPGETVLAFYTAKNNGDQDVVGVSTYNVTPGKAGAYFNKIQCFCFEEQLLRKGEEVDMPVFFFLDPEIVEDPLLQDVETITLSYTFFNSRNMSLAAAAASSK